MRCALVSLADKSMHSHAAERAYSARFRSCLEHRERAMLVRRVRTASWLPGHGGQPPQRTGVAGSAG
jgi:hypothetical protein